MRNAHFPTCMHLSPAHTHSSKGQRQHGLHLGSTAPGQSTPLAEQLRPSQVPEPDMLDATRDKLGVGIGTELSREDAASVTHRLCHLGAWRREGGREGGRVEENNKVVGCNEILNEL